MSEPNSTNSTEAQNAKAAEQAQKARTERVATVGWTAGLAAFFLVMGMGSSPTWPMAVAICAIAAMVASACYFMLK